MNKAKQRHRREKRLAKQAAEKAVALSQLPIIDGQTLLKMFEQRLDKVFGQSRNPLLAGLKAKSKIEV